ncbi:MAG: MFS transporter [Rhodospirillales bacterium]|nr:MFS transporter [Rhodospirillales bacterium]
MSPPIPKPATFARRNIVILSLCQALFMIGTSTMIAEAALVGHMLAVDKSLATLPIAFQQLAAMLTTFPASLLMKYLGRRWGFSIGAVFGIVAQAIAVAAVFAGSFWLFCLATAFNGVYTGFALFYRFAAVDGASESMRGKAISYVLAGGVIAAVIGPEMAKYTKDLFTPAVFAGSFASLIVIAMLALILLQFINIPRPTQSERAAGGRSFGEIGRQPAFVVAVLGGMISYGVMSFVMNATPLAMVAHNHSFSSAAFVIQWHVLAMFAPSFFTGQIIARFGVVNVMTTGGALLGLCAAVNLAGTAVPHFWLALVLLGLGWNFLYVGATTLLTETYTPTERAKVQAVNEFLVFGAVALGAYVAGAMLETRGWQAVNYASLPFVAVALVTTLWYARRRRR